MEFTIPRRDLLTELQALSRVTDGGKFAPALACVHLRVEGTTVHLAATDLMQGLTGRLEAEKASPGSTCIPAKELAERVKAMPDGPLTLTVDGHRATLRAAGKARKFTMSCLSGEDFPGIPSPSDGAVMTLSAMVLAGLIDRVFEAISQDETRPHMNAAKVEWSGNALKVVATDGHRLHRAEATTEASGMLDVLLSRKGLSELRKACDAAGDLQILTSERRVFFQVTPGRCLSMPIVDGAFPPYEHVIPKAWTHEVQVSREALQEAVRAVSVSAATKSGGLALRFSQRDGASTIEVSATSDSGDASDTCELDTEWKGPELRIGMNHVYLSQALAAARDERVTLRTGGELEPVLMVADGFTGVLMPMRV